MLTMAPDKQKTGENRDAFLLSATAFPGRSFHPEILSSCPMWKEKGDKKEQDRIEQDRTGQEKPGRLLFRDGLVTRPRLGTPGDAPSAPSMLHAQKNFAHT
jgi:hypothetical protein